MVDPLGIYSKNKTSSEPQKTIVISFFLENYFLVFSASGDPLRTHFIDFCVISVRIPSTNQPSSVPGDNSKKNVVLERSQIIFLELL